MVIVYDVKNQKFIEHRPGGTFGHFSLHRLATEILRAAGEVRENEEVTHLAIDGDIVSFRAEIKSGS